MGEKSRNFSVSGETLHLCVVVVSRSGELGKEVESSTLDTEAHGSEGRWVSTAPREC